MPKNRQRNTFPSDDYLFCGRRGSYNRHNFCLSSSLSESNWDVGDSPKTIISAVNRLEEIDYVTANSQLLIRPSSKNKIAFDNPDFAVPWSDVLAVKWYESEKSVCPICLEEPVLPRMGPCGHIYCLLCVSYYIAFENDTSSKQCAVCNTQLNTHELKRVCIFSSSVPKVGNVVQLKLMRRHKNSYFPIVLSDGDRDSELGFLANNMTSRFLSRIAVAKYDDLDDLVKEDISFMNAYVDEKVPDGSIELADSIAKRVLRNLKKERRVMSGTFFNRNETSLIEERNTSEDRYLYYQEVSGHDIYLHSVNWRCLVKQFTMSNLPQEISGKVIEVETYAMSSALRSRYSYLGHLPLGRVFHLVEVELESPTIKKEILFFFADALYMRQQRRKSKEALDTELTRAKVEAEDMFQSLPTDLWLSRRVSTKQVVPTADDFIPLDDALAEVLSLENRRETIAVPLTSTSSYLPSRTFASVTPGIDSSEKLNTTSWSDVVSRNQGANSTAPDAGIVATVSSLLEAPSGPSVNCVDLQETGQDTQSKRRRNKRHSKLAVNLVSSGSA